MLPQHQAIVRTNIDLSSSFLPFTYMTAISQELHMNIIRNMCPEIALWKLLPHIQGANELKWRD